MEYRRSYTITEIVDQPGAGRGFLIVLALCFLLMICDSYDVSALSFVAPTLIRSWSLKSTTMGGLFSIGLSGLLMGSILFGRLGDQIGRKRALIAGALLFTVLTFATASANSISVLFALRFGASLGLGGAVPNAVALTSELSPKRLRVTSVGIIFAGYSIGGILSGLTAGYLIPVLGWRYVFLMGGALSAVATVCFLLFLPESLSFAASREDGKAEAVRIAKWLRPELRRQDDFRIVPDYVFGQSSARFSSLFSGRLAIVTPIIWTIYVANSITVFFLTSWTPVAVQSAGVAPRIAIFATTILYLGGAIGGVLGGRLTDRFGVTAVVWTALAACPAVAAIGWQNVGTSGLLTFSFCAGLFAFGTQTCLHGIAGTLYPANIRANGVGWAIGIGKVGSIIGPLLGGLLMSRLNSSQLFLAAGCPPLIVALMMTVLRLTLTRHRPPDAGLVERRRPLF